MIEYLLTGRLCLRIIRIFASSLVSWHKLHSIWKNPKLVVTVWIDPLSQFNATVGTVGVCHEIVRFRVNRTRTKKRLYAFKGYYSLRAYFKACEHFRNSILFYRTNRSPIKTCGFSEFFIGIKKKTLIIIIKKVKKLIRYRTRRAWFRP